MSEPKSTLECGDSSPLLLAAIRRGAIRTADKSAVEKAGASSRSPKIVVRNLERFVRVRGNEITRDVWYERGGSLSRNNP